MEQWLGPKELLYGRKLQRRLVLLHPHNNSNINTLPLMSTNISYYVIIE